ncbi:MAG: ATP-binding protein [Vallitaleaceae bacterium]|nr:ATP-binding protein [Vallitaleaceae bacterium]
MYRKLIESLKVWKNKKDRLPLVLKGARQVGKTWLLNEFGKTCFDDVLYINFENAGNLSELFEGVIEPHRIIDMLGALFGKRILPHKTLIIFDEVQEVPRALTALKYFAENAPEYTICCAGSLLGVALHQGTSFPVGKVDFLTLQPLSFEEFLISNGEQTLCEYINKMELATIPSPFIDKLSDYLKIYFVVGGMPAAVKIWLDERDFSMVEEKQRAILDTYTQDFSKHAPTNIVPKLRYLWESIPSQLAKENKKFIYGLVKEGARAREYEDALLWLVDSGLIRRVGRITKGALPLKAYEDLKSFKLYHLDIGLLRVMSELAPRVITESNKVFEEFKGALTEQYVLQELSSNMNRIRSLYYWTSEATAEVDFVFSDGQKVIPLEVKASENLQARSLKVFRDKYGTELALRASLSNLKLDYGLLNIPLHVIWALEHFTELVDHLKPLR